MTASEWEELAAEVASMAADGVPPLIALSRLEFGKRIAGRGKRGHTIASAFDFFRGWIAWIYECAEVEADVTDLEAYQAGALARLLSEPEGVEITIAISSSVAREIERSIDVAEDAAVAELEAELERAS